MGRLEEAEECFERASEHPDGRADAVRGLEMLRLQYAEQGNTEAAARIGRWLAQLGELVS
jgi:hypothetical protein